MKTLYIHIGSPKTGTSAFQGYMYMNSTFLAANNISYFNELMHEDNSNHWHLSYRLRQYLTEPNSSYITEAVATISNTPQDIGLISSEGLSFWIKKKEGFQVFIEQLKANGIECRIIAVIRNPLDYLISNYGESIVGGNSSLNFAEWLESRQGVEHLNFLRSIKCWSTLIHPHDFFWINYESRTDFPRRILEYVLGSLQVQESVPEQQPFQANVSKSGTEIELYRRINKIFYPAYNKKSIPPRNSIVTTFISNHLQLEALKTDQPYTLQLDKATLSTFQKNVDAMTKEANTLPFLNAKAPFEYYTSEQILARLQQKLAYQAAFVRREEKRITWIYKKMKYTHWIYSAFRQPSPYLHEPILHIK